MALRLRDDVHWCDCAGRAVFLDAQADRYFCLPKSANDAFLRLAFGELEPQDPQQLRILLSRGILIETPERARLPSPPLIEPPTCDFVGEPFPGAGLLHILRALASEMRAAWLLRTRSFQRVIEAAGRSPKRGRAQADPDRLLQEIVEASRATAFLTRAHNRCLVRALAVHACCKKSGIRPKLVFGVIAHPFAAHCWVQLGSAVLVGGFEQAQLYTPIAVLE
jgi:hypothetical protein